MQLGILALLPILQAHEHQRGVGKRQRVEDVHRGKRDRGAHARGVVYDLLDLPEHHIGALQGGAFGQLDGDDLANAYAAMDVFVHCVTEETFGQTIQEAHASGLPVIAPSKGGQRHLIQDGVNGFLVDHTRWGSFREKAEALLSDDLLRARFAHEAVRAVEGKTWEANNRRLMDFYELVCTAADLEPSVAA